MLVVTRKEKESIVLQHLGVIIQIDINKIEKGKVSVAINAPDNVKIYRDDWYNNMVNQHVKRLKEQECRYK